MSKSRQPVQHNDSEQQRIFVDFHNADAQGRLRLNCIGTIEDLSAQKIELQTGQHLTLYSEDLEVDGIVEYSQSEHLWVVVIDWDEIREIEEDEREKFINEAKQILKNIPAIFIKEQDNSDALIYHQFATKFGEKEAEEIWSARGWNTNIVFRDLALILRDDPQLRQRIEQAGINLEECINIFSQEVEFMKISPELPQTDQRALARLREVILL